MPSFSPNARVVSTGIERDYELVPRGFYRGRGQDQAATGPNGPWLDGAAAGQMRAPESRAERRHGRPPRGYVRSDARVHEDVCEALGAHADFDASDIEVAVEEGLVTLRGEVQSRYAKFYAEDLAAGVRGVVDVQNELRIRRPMEGGPSSDARGLPRFGGPRDT